MPIQTADYVDVEERIRDLGLTPAEGLVFLPRHFATASSPDELQHEDSMPTVRAVFGERGIVAIPLQRPGASLRHIEDNAYEWVGPVIFIGAGIFLGKAELINQAVEALVTYLKSHFKGREEEKHQVKFQIVVPQQHSKKYTKIDYEGDVDGIPGLIKTIKEVRNGRKPK